MAEKELNGTTITTPSGLEIYYQSKPKRLYKVNGEEVPSVTQSLDILHKPALLWWSQGVGIEAVLALYDKGAMMPYVDAAEKRHLLVGVDGKWEFATKENVSQAVTDHHLTINHVTGKAADRGQAAHDSFEAWLREGVLPVPHLHTDEEAPYVAGLLKFIEDVNMQSHVESELQVGSLEYGYAGRLDHIVNMGPCSLIYKKPSPKGRRPEIRWNPTPGRWMWDLKTAKEFYPTHYIQLEAYEQALTESGYSPTIGHMVIKVDKDGGYQARQSRATLDQYLAILGLYLALKQLEEAMK